MALLTSISDLAIFGIPIVNREGFFELLLRFGLNVIVTSLIIVWLYYGKSKRRDYVFTFTLISTTVFLLIFLLGSEKLQIGLALGLFAIFGIIRYRTDTVPIREMTYLFLIISLAAINGLAWAADISPKHPEFAGPLMTSMGELLLTDLVFVAGVWIAEANRLVKSLSSKYIKYDKIDLIKPYMRKELIEDLKARTGLDITNVSIGSIDFLKDMALIKIYYNTDEEDESAQKMPKEYA